MKSDKLTISLSFDDGRIDTYTNAYKIMQKYNLTGTVHIITGYVDKTWDYPGLASSRGAISIEQLTEMKKNGIEISLHGDKHTSESKDFATSLEKARKWNLIINNFGFSVPYSNEQKLMEKSFQETLHKNKVAYVRVGKNIKKMDAIRKISYVLYNLLRLNIFYLIYNKYNVEDKKEYDKFHLNSVVVKKNDSIKFLKELILKNVNKEKWIIFMFHSILNENDSLYKTSCWAWSEKNFDKFCKFLDDLRKQEKIEILPIIDVILKR